MNIVVDASAALQFLLRTSIGLRIEGIVAEADLLAPELLDVEVASVITSDGPLARIPVPTGVFVHDVTRK